MRWVFITEIWYYRARRRRGSSRSRRPSPKRFRPSTVSAIARPGKIASRVSTTRETVARVFSQLYSSGLLRRKGRNLYLMDRDKLAAFLAGSPAGKAP